MVPGSPAGDRSPGGLSAAQAFVRGKLLQRADKRQLQGCTSCSSAAPRFPAVPKTAEQDCSQPRASPTPLILETSSVSAPGGRSEGQKPPEKQLETQNHVFWPRISLRNQRSAPEPNTEPGSAGCPHLGDAQPRLQERLRLSSSRLVGAAPEG